MKSILSIPNVSPENIESTIQQLRQMVNGAISWHWVQGVLYVTVQEKSLSIRGKTIARIVYHDEKSWVAQYERDAGRWLLVASRGDWYEKVTGEECC